MLEQATEFTYTKASRRRRIFAFIIDHIILCFLLVLITLILFGQGAVVDNNPNYVASILISSTAVIISVYNTYLLIPIFLVYLCKDVIKGNSFGKWMMAIMVRDKNQPNTIPSVLRLFLRNIFIIIWPIELIILLVRKDKERLGDKLTKSIVVNNPKKPKKVSRILLLLVLIILLPLSIYFVGGYLLTQSAAYPVAIAQIEQNKQIQAAVGGIKGYGWPPSGEIVTVNGDGQAVLIIKVKGNTKDIKVAVILKKKLNGQWELVEIEK